MISVRQFRITAFLMSWVGNACIGTVGSVDGATPLDSGLVADAGGGVDGGSNPRDGGGLDGGRADAASSDAGGTTADAGSALPDAGAPSPDAGGPSDAGGPDAGSSIVLNSTLVITSADNGTTLSNYRVSTTTGDCVDVSGATGVTLENFDIGPCGGNGIQISNSNGVDVYDSYVHVEHQATSCCDTHDGVFVVSSSNVQLQGNVIAYSETNIEVGGGASDSVTVTGNFLLNPLGAFPRGQNFQSWGQSGASNTNVTVSANYAFSCVLAGSGLPGVVCPPVDQVGNAYLLSENQEDSINFGLTNGIVASGNWIHGGHSGSGCGLIADDSADSAQFVDNILSNTGQCAIGVASGTNQTLTGNKFENLDPISGAGNSGLYIWNQYTSACGPVTVSNNVGTQVQSPIGCSPSTSSCSYSAFWNGGGCGTPSLSGNTFDNGTFGPGSAPAFVVLDPVATTHPPPLVPPSPKNCVVLSPYTTQTSLPPCP